MKKKLSFIFLILINVCFVNVAFAQSEWIMLNNNVKTSTFGNTKYLDKKFSVDEAVQVMMFLSRGYNEWNFDVKTYSKKEFAKTKDFSDEYIYGSAVNAVTKLGYGLVAMDYYLFENEVVSEEGWNGMYLMRLKDDSILCAKLIKPTGAYIADECVWDQNKDMLILSNKNFAYEIHICLYGLPIEEGEYQVLGSDGEYKLEADCIDNGNWAEAKTTLFIRYDGNTIKAYGNASLYTPTNDNIDFYYKGNLVVQ